MATRTIVTSQPDVACAVCARRLLRGEHADVFVTAGRRRIVCELCAPRAAHEGWLRETESQSLSLPPMRPRRGRSLLERLPMPFRVRPPEDSAPVGTPPGDAHGGLATGSSDESEAGPQGLQHDLPQALPAVDFLEPAGGAGSSLQAAAPGELARQALALGKPSLHVEQAIAVFNASEFPRRVAGVTRSLGAPTVTVRSADHRRSSVVSIVVAWELCWYRYEVDLSEPVAEAQVTAQGTELDELAREDRVANAAAAESGTLTLPA
jgi:hypothetical protein